MPHISNAIKPHLYLHYSTSTEKNHFKIGPTKHFHFHPDLELTRHPNNNHPDSFKCGVGLIMTSRYSINFLASSISSSLMVCHLPWQFIIAHKSFQGVEPFPFGFASKIRLFLDSNSKSKIV
jgi:hypothetical protein